MECEMHFEETYKRDSNGRYEVRMPFSTNHTELGDSLEAAPQHFKGMERRLQRNPKLKHDYINFLREYDSLGHMTKIDSPNDNAAQTYYLPHHCVIKEDSTTTKLTVVFDASAKTTSGLSLNDVTKTGPVIQRDLFSIVLNFRKHNIVLTADIEKMYRQVNVSMSDRDYQRIVWREEPGQELQHYRLNTVTYGTAPASFLAVRPLQQAAIDNCTDSRIIEIIKSDFYMDDLITGTDTLDDALYLKQKITDTLQGGCFPLRKWRSNDKRILTNDRQGNEYALSDNKTVKTLGLFWEAESDTLNYSINLSINGEITKRSILAAVSKIYDPLGLISPITIRAKLIMQHLWQFHRNWDETLPDNIGESWQQFRTELIALNNLKIPRQVTAKKVTDIQLHGFCDASERGYGACIYIRTTDANGRHYVNLLCAKSRVAPLRRVTLPRLELCGAVLLARLVLKIMEGFGISFTRRQLWCDSTIVLSWISAEAANWKTFVANRVAEIRESSCVDEWQHVKSELNPADVISRGTSPEQLIQNTL